MIKVYDYNNSQNLLQLWVVYFPGIFLILVLSLALFFFSMVPFHHVHHPAIDFDVLCSISVRNNGFTDFLSKNVLKAMY